MLEFYKIKCNLSLFYVFSIYGNPSFWKWIILQTEGLNVHPCHIKIKFTANPFYGTKRRANTKRCFMSAKTIREELEISIERGKGYMSWLNSPFSSSNSSTLLVGLWRGLEPNAPQLLRRAHYYFAIQPPCYKC